jgi:integrase
LSSFEVAVGDLRATELLLLWCEESCPCRNTELNSLSRDWYRLAHRIGLPDLRLHDLRHAFATRLLEASVHPKVVGEALGHSSVSFTMDTYQHLMPTMQDAATRAIEDAIGGTVAAGLDDA